MGSKADRTITRKLNRSSSRRAAALLAFALLLAAVVTVPTAGAQAPGLVCASGVGGDVTITTNANGQPISDAADTINGTPGDDVIQGLGGADTINGKGGDDFICQAADGSTDVSGGTINGGTGREFIFGSGGPDEIHGGDEPRGGDIIFGFAFTTGDSPLIINDAVVACTAPGTRESTTDILDGGAGKDQLATGAGSDQLFGGPGPDLLIGGEGDDKLFGGSGEDNDPGSGADTLTDSAAGLFGCGGEDDLNGGGQDDDLNGGAGNDAIEGGGGRGNDFADGGPGIDAILGGSGEDKLRGGTEDDDIDGGDGEDVLRGDDGDDDLFGGPAFDRIFGGLGDDNLDGGADRARCDGGGQAADTFRRCRKKQTTPPPPTSGLDRDLGIEIVGLPARVQKGQAFDFGVTIRNNGRQSESYLAGVEVLTSPPNPNFDCVTTSPQESIGHANFSGTLAAGDTDQFRVDVSRCDRVGQHSIEANVSISDGTPDDEPLNNRVLGGFIVDP